MSIQFKIEKDGENLRYVDTTSNLERRTKDLIKYINNPKEHQKLYLVYKYIHDNGGLNDNGGWKIMEINEGNEDERDGLDACNLQMVLKPKITDEQKKENARKHRKTYYHKNKELHRVKHKKYREDNKDSLKVKSQSYYNDNRDKILGKKGEKVYCEFCKKSVGKGYMTVHLKTDNHKLMKQISGGHYLFEDD